MTIPLSRRRAGFTLLELLVVVAVLALLAAIAIPRFGDIFERGRSSTQAYSLADVARQLEIYSAVNRNSFPDGWDTLMSSATSSALYSKLAPEIESPNNFLTTSTLDSTQIASLSAVGIGHCFLHDSTSAASDSGTDRRHFGTGTGHDGTANINTFAVIDKTFTAGASGAAPTLGDGMNLLVNSFGLNPNKTGTDSEFQRIMSNTYIVFGLGPKSAMVGTQITEAPILEHTTSSANYSRALVVFEVPNATTYNGSANPAYGGKAKLVGVFGPDGRSKRVAIGDFNSSTVVPH